MSTTRSVLTAAAAAAFFLGVPWAGAPLAGVPPAHAASTAKEAAAAKPSSTAAGQAETAPTETGGRHALLRLSDDAFKTVRNVRRARLAIFSGMPDDASTFTEAAKTDIEAVVKDADRYAVKTKTPVREGDIYVPFDSSLALADSFIATPEKADKVSKANEHLKKGEKMEAAQALKLADIDVVFTTAMLPVKLSQVHIDDALQLLHKGKFYEANLALKAVDDAVVVESWGLDEPVAPSRAANTK